jgi:hypothetical protein
VTLPAGWVAKFGLLPETSQQEALQVIHRVQAMLDGACQAASLPRLPVSRSA